MSWPSVALSLQPSSTHSHHTTANTYQILHHSITPGLTLHQTKTINKTKNLSYNISTLPNQYHTYSIFHFMLFMQIYIYIDEHIKSFTMCRQLNLPTSILKWQIGFTTLLHNGDNRWSLSFIVHQVRNMIKGIIMDCHHPCH